MFARERGFEELVRQRAELLQHAVESVVADRVPPLRSRGHRRETDLVKSDVVRQVPENAMHVQRLRRERDARPNRPAAMLPQQLADLRSNDVVTAHTAFEDSKLVLHLLRAV